MPPRDRECCGDGSCREAVLGLVFEGRFPNERYVEMLLDRLEADRPTREEPVLGAPR